MSWFMGLDNSTQSLSAVVTDAETGSLVARESVDFDRDLPEYNLSQGVVPGTFSLVKHSDPLAWTAALDLIMQRLVDGGVDLSRISAISGSAQQHGTVYLKKDFSALGYEDMAGTSLVPCVESMLSRPTAPIWMDSSTTAECNEIGEEAGGSAYIQRTTGSLPIERFSAPQIRKFYKEEPSRYGDTARIHLVSSFMASLLTCTDAPIDYGDGAGMNLMDIENAKWDPEILQATAPNLRERLPDLVPSHTKVGRISDFFVRKFGFSEDTVIVTWSGDNPNSLIGVGGWSPETAVVSLGTSDTYFAAMSKPLVDPGGYGHVFGNPAGGYMGLICFKNGSLAREKIKEAHGLSWKQFDQEAVEKTPAGNNGNMMLPYFVSEITPAVLNPEPVYRGSEDFINGGDPWGAVRGVQEAQCLSMRHHAGWLKERASVIRVTGGASRGFGIRRILADVFNANVERLEVENSAALGAAMRAEQASTENDWEVITDKFCRVDPDQTLNPIPENVQVYDQMMPEFLDMLAEVRQQEE